MMRRASMLVLLLGLATPAPIVHAAEPTPAERFQAFTTEAEAHFAAGRYDEAISSYLQAYGSVPSPDVLYNVGYIYESFLKKPDLATDFYRRVVRDPSSRPDMVKLATERITAIEAAAAAGSVRPSVLTGPGPGPTPGVGGGVQLPPAEEPSVVPWVLIGVGGAAIVAGVLVGVAAEGKNDDFEAHLGGLAGMRDSKDTGKTLALATDILWISGLAAAVTGTVLVLTRDEAPARAGWHMSPFAGDRAAGMAVTTGF